jgi:hypothetical protein
MIWKSPLLNVFIQLSDSLQQLSDAEYVQPSKVLFNATIGQHTRHIIELFTCLLNGYESGSVNYEKRKRDFKIETERSFAAGLLKEIYHSLDNPNKAIVLEAADYADIAELIAIPSNYYRELAYNLEHTIHHMALIRVGITDVSTIELPDQFGVAFSTIKYRRQCAQ